MLKDLYYIKSLVSTCLVLALMLTGLFLAAYMTGIIGLVVFFITLLLFFAGVYRRGGRPAGKDLLKTKSPRQTAEERP